MRLGCAAMLVGVLLAAAPAFSQSANNSRITSDVNADANATDGTPSGAPASAGSAAAPAQKPSASSSAAIDDEATPAYNPIAATTGTLGLFTLETGDLLPKHGWSASAFGDRFTRMPGSVVVTGAESTLDTG